MKKPNQKPASIRSLTPDEMTGLVGGLIIKKPIPGSTPTTTDTTTVV